ncbi:MAG: cupin domain-containing protein [Muribaculaceae bacterium]|nr:cupin domain-containing protein [Muribaculaceae bacterium]MDE5930552.1 cupin domain-containing protein [Muribaculaceae bacterium]MDE6130603.1 cupin domain-containing protein [Muribaculaceae bacterium]
MKLLSSVEYQQGRVTATDLVKNDNGQVTLIAFDEGGLLARHKAPGDAMVQVLEGEVVFVVEDTKNQLSAGDYLTMSAGTPHEVYAETKAKVLLTLIKSDACGCQAEKQAEAEGLLPD